MCCNASLHELQWGLYKRVWVCGNYGKKDVWQSILPHIWNRWTIRWDFIGNSLAWTPTKFQQNSNDLFYGKMLWQNVSLKCLCFSISGVAQNKIRGISWKFRWESVQTHEIPTKSWRNKIAKIQLYKDSLQMVKYHGRATLQFVYKYMLIYIYIYVYYSVYIYISLFVIHWW